MCKTQRSLGLAQKHKNVRNRLRRVLKSCIRPEYGICAYKNRIPSTPRVSTFCSNQTQKSSIFTQIQHFGRYWRIFGYSCSQLWIPSGSLKLDPQLRRGRILGKYNYSAHAAIDLIPRANPSMPWLAHKNSRSDTPITRKDKKKTNDQPRTHKKEQTTVHAPYEAWSVASTLKACRQRMLFSVILNGDFEHFPDELDPSNSKTPPGSTSRYWNKFFAHRKKFRKS